MLQKIMNQTWYFLLFYFSSCYGNILLQDDPTRLQQVEQIHNLSQQVIQRPNRTCLSDVNNTANFAFKSLQNRKHTLRSIIPSQNTLFELAQNKPDATRWTLTFQEEVNKTL